jgi:hypothetical protein
MFPHPLQMLCRDFTSFSRSFITIRQQGIFLFNRIYKIMYRNPPFLLELWGLNAQICNNKWNVWAGSRRVIKHKALQTCIVMTEEHTSKALWMVGFGWWLWVSGHYWCVVKGRVVIMRGYMGLEGWIMRRNYVWHYRMVICRAEIYLE